MDMKCNAKKITERYAIYNADTTEAIKAIPDESVSMIVYSPPLLRIVYLLKQREGSREFP